MPIEVSRLVDRLLSKKPTERVATAAEAEKELATLLNNLQQRGVSIQTGPAQPSPLAQRTKAIAQNKVVRGMTMVVAAIALILFGRALPTMLPEMWPGSSTANESSGESSSESANGPNNVVGDSGLASGQTNASSSGKLIEAEPPANAFALLELIEAERAWQASSQQQAMEMNELDREISMLQLELNHSRHSIDAFEAKADELRLQLDTLQFQWNAELQPLETIQPAVVVPQ